MLELYKNSETSETEKEGIRQDLDVPFKKPELNIEECRKILNTGGEHFTDEEIIEIRTLILNLVEIDYKMYQKRKAQSRKQMKVIHLAPQETNYNKAA